MKNLAVIRKINAGILFATGYNDFKLSEMVKVGEKKLMGEVIKIYSDYSVIQVFEDVTGLKIGDKIYPTGELLSLELGPGIIGNIFDGIHNA